MRSTTPKNAAEQADRANQGGQTGPHEPASAAPFATYESLPLERLKTEAERWIPFIAEERGAVPDAFGNASRGLRDIVQRAFDLGASGAPSATRVESEEKRRAFEPEDDGHIW